jgi:hypothetical protein
MLNFPNAPTNGQTYGVYKYDGEKWVTPPQKPLTVGDPPSDTNPLMNGTILPGLTTLYARGNHRHPRDTTRVGTAAATLTGASNAVTGNISGLVVNGKIVANGKGHLLGAPSGSYTAPDRPNTNIVLYTYDAAAGNWAGIGTDYNGRWFLRSGLSGLPQAAMAIDQSRTTIFAKPPRVPTPAAGDNSGQAATTAFVQQNPATGPYLLLSGGNVTGLMYINGDLRTYRSDGTGVIFLNNTGDRYLYYNGNYNFNAAHVNTAAGRLWGNNDWNWPFIDQRLAFLADYNHAASSGLAEPYNGGCVTGSSGYQGQYPTYYGITYRYRQWQFQTPQGWYAVGYA